MTEAEFTKIAEECMREENQQGILRDMDREAKAAALKEKRSARLQTTLFFLSLAGVRFDFDGHSKRFASIKIPQQTLRTRVECEDLPECSRRLIPSPVAGSKKGKSSRS